MGYSEFLILVSSWALASALQDLSFVISQKGLDQLGVFARREALGVLQNEGPLTLNLVSKDKPGFGPLGVVQLRNLIRLKTLHLLLENNAIGLLLKDLDLKSTADLKATILPIPFGEETLWINLTISQVYIGVHEDLTLKSCSISQPEIQTAAKNYWLLDGGVKLGAKWLKNQMPSMFCNQLKSFLQAMEGRLSSSVALGDLISRDSLPRPLKNLSDVQLHYSLVGLRVKEGHLAAKLRIDWELHEPTVSKLPLTKKLQEEEEPEVAIEYGELPSMNDSFPTNDSDNELLFELEEVNGHHLTVWLQPEIVNSLLRLLDWTFPWMNETVPIGSAKIPEKSRRFLLTLCNDCFFEMRVWSDGAPQVRAMEETLDLRLWNRVKLWVVNPRHPEDNQTSIFVHFRSFFNVQIQPFAKDGRLKAKIDLEGVKVDMLESAFPEEAYGKELVQGAIMDMIWPEIKEGLEEYSWKIGLLVPRTCGVAPDSVAIRLKNGRFGIGADLRLEDIDFDRCGADFQRHFQSM